MVKLERPLNLKAAKAFLKAQLDETLLEKELKGLRIVVDVDCG